MRQLELGQVIGFRGSCVCENRGIDKLVEEEEIWEKDLRRLPVALGCCQHEAHATQESRLKEILSSLCLQPAKEVPIGGKLLRKWNYLDGCKNSPWFWWNCRRVWLLSRVHLLGANDFVTSFEEASLKWMSNSDKQKHIWWWCCCCSPRGDEYYNGE